MVMGLDFIQIAVLLGHPEHPVDTAGGDRYAFAVPPPAQDAAYVFAVFDQRRNPVNLHYSNRLRHGLTKLIPEATPDPRALARPT